MNIGLCVDVKKSVCETESVGSFVDSIVLIHRVQDTYANVIHPYPDI